MQLRIRMVLIRHLHVKYLLPVACKHISTSDYNLAVLFCINDEDLFILSKKDEDIAKSL